MNISSFHIQDDSVSIVCFSLRAAGGSGLYFVVALHGCICWVNWGILLDDAGSGHVWVDPLVICHMVVFFALEVWDAEVSNFVTSLRK